MPGSASYDLDLRTACAAAVSTAGFTADGGYPLLTAALATSPAKFWRQVWEYWINGKIPTGTRVLCGIAIPCFSSDYDLSRETALALGITPTSGDAPGVDREICDWAGDPYAF